MRSGARKREKRNYIEPRKPAGLYNNPEHTLFGPVSLLFKCWLDWSVYQPAVRSLEDE